MPQPAYVPQPGSAPARAIAYLAARPWGDAEISSKELAGAIGVSVNAISAYLTSATHHRLLVRVTRDRKSYWRLGAAHAPGAEPARAASQIDEHDEAPPVAPIVPAAFAASLSGVMRQSWHPMVQDSEAEGAPNDPLPDEPAAPDRRPAPAPPGLGWKAPSRVRVPVFGRDAALENTTPAPGLSYADRVVAVALGDFDGAESRRRVETDGLPRFVMSAPPGAMPPESAPAALGDACIGANEGLEVTALRVEGDALVAAMRTTNDETARDLAAALAPAPPDDPDFLEVRIHPGNVGYHALLLGKMPDPDNPPPKGAESAQAPSSCGRDDATPSNGVVPQSVEVKIDGDGQDDQFSCALWSDGTFSIRPTDGDGLVLNKEDARQLMRYVSEVLSARARASA